MTGALLSIEEPQLAVGPTVRARIDAFGERPQRGDPVDTLGPLPGHVASADVDVHGWRVATEADFDEPVGCWWLCLDAASAFLLAAFFGGDPASGAFQVAQLYALQEAELGESRRAGVVHVFDISG